MAERQETPDKPDWIDEARDDGRWDMDSAPDEIAAVFREHFLKAARCPRCKGEGTLTRLGPADCCGHCCGRGFIAPETKGAERA